MKKRKSVEKEEASKISSLVSSDYEFEEEKLKEGIGLYMVTYAECLTFGEGVPYIDFDLDLLGTRYASILWDYDSRKEKEKAQSDDEAPMRHPRKIGIPEDTEVHEI
ncbi:hypothetical protein FXO38_18193 [Capsicum annuum]|nr:hypothetical protein FXO38_18193 [Capsicum annuum]